MEITQAVFLKFKGVIMKKIFLSILVFTSLVFTNSYAQYKPNMQLILKGVINVPFYDLLSENTSNSAFGGFQAEPVVNLSYNWAVFGTFNYGFVPAKADISPDYGIYNFKSSREISGYVGPRYYFAPEDGRYVKVYVDAGVGVYSFNFSDAVYTNTNPSYTKTYSYPSFTQIGLNLGTGINVNLNSSVFLNFGARLHNLFPKTEEQTTTIVYSNGTQTEIIKKNRDIGNNNYLQLTAGVGFRFGL